MNFIKNYKGRLAPFFLSMVMSFTLSAASAENKPVMPFTASELPVIATTPNLIYGASGPQVNLDSAGFKSIPKPIYIDKELETQLTKKSGTDTISDQSSPPPFEQLNIQYNPLLKKESQVVAIKNLGFQELQEIARKELLQCQDSGYVCDAVIARQDNVLNMVLTPLLVESVQIEGEGDSPKKGLNSLLRWIHSDQPLKLHDAERQLRLIQSNPDLTFSAELEVIPYSHQIQIKVTATEAKNPVHIATSWNNLDQPIFGRQFGAITEVHNNLTGHGDSLMTSVVQGYRSTGLFSHYEYPVTPAFRPYVEASIAKISPFQALYTTSDTHGWATRITAGLKYVLYDRPNRRLSADIDFDFKQAYSRAHGGDMPLEREAVRTIRGGINYDQKWKTAGMSMRHEFAGGLPIFAGSLSDDSRLSWYKGGSQYFRYTGYAFLTKQLPLDSSATLNTQWQFTPNGLSNFDVGGLGGAFYGRGYREVYLFVDNYSITSLQWQVPAHFLPKNLKVPFSNKDVRDTLSLLTFVDYGYGKISAAPKGVQPNYQILSTGLGVRSQLTNRISGRLDIGFPILREAPFSQKPRIHFGLDIALF